MPTTTEHPRMPVEQRVPLAAAFALDHTQGFTLAKLADALHCSQGVASYTLAGLGRRLAHSPIAVSDMTREGLGPREGWERTSDDHHGDLHRYRLTVRKASKGLKKAGGG